MDNRISIDKIYTYKDPYKIDKMSIWNDMEKYPNLCVSQTLVEGMKEYYGRDKFQIICTIDSVLKKFYKDWHDSEENNVHQSITMTNILDSWKEDKSKKTELINSIYHNRKDFMKSIKYLIESDIDPDIDKNIESLLSQEQQMLMDMYKRACKVEWFQTLKTEKTKEDLDECYVDILRDELKKYIDNKDIDKRKIEDKESIVAIEEEMEEIEKKIEEYNTKKSVKSIDEEQRAKNEKIHANLMNTYTKIEHILSVFKKYKKHKLTGMIKTNKVFIHGIHQFTPLILRFIKELKKLDIEVIAVFNYIDTYPEIYKTWENVYEWCNKKFEKEGDDYPDPRKIGKDLGKIYKNNMGQITLGYDEQYYMYDNLTGFSDYVGEVYEKAVNQFNKEDKNSSNEKLRKIALMEEQFYAIDGKKINELLKVYFPEQFSSRHFLTYPVGQFILSLYNMWNDKEERKKSDKKFTGLVVNENNIKEALSLGIWERQDMPTPIEIFNNLKFYFRNEDNLEGYMKKLDKLIKIEETSTCDYRKRMAFCVHSKEELEYFKRVLKSIKDIVENLFENPKDNIKDNFEKMINHIKHLVYNPLYEERVTDEELDMVEQISKRLDTIKKTEEKAYISNIRDTLTFYLQASTSKEYEAEWIVRDFEQIDGGILLAAAQKRDRKEATGSKKFHYAGVCDENMLGRVKKELPWPLTNEMYRNLDNPIAEICSLCRSEYNQFLKYSLFYGMYFLTDNKNIVVSYIKELGEDTTYPYSILSEIMKINQIDYMEDKLAIPKYDEEIYGNYEEVEINEYEDLSGAEKRSMETCYKRFLWNHCLDKDTFFIEDFHLDQITKFFIEYNCLIKKDNNKLNEKVFNKFKNLFPCFDETDYLEIQNAINKRRNGHKEGYINSKMEFIFRQMGQYYKDKKDAIRDFKEQLDKEDKKIVEEDLCKNCNQRSLCEEYIEYMAVE